jgi:hypothetical protein
VTGFDDVPLLQLGFSRSMVCIVSGVGVSLSAPSFGYVIALSLLGNQEFAAFGLM